MLISSSSLITDKIFICWYLELVYVISVSKNKRRVDVIFRGTATSNDVLKDLDPGVMAFPNPIEGGYPGKTDSIELQRGFAGTCMLMYTFTSHQEPQLTESNAHAFRISLR